MIPKTEANSPHAYRKENMRIINYKRGYNNTFNCSIHGTIEMTLREWEIALAWLKRSTKPFQYYDDGRFRKNIFLEDIQRTIKTPKSMLLNIRTTPTESLVKKYKLQGYKQGNYQLRII